MPEVGVHEAKTHLSRLLRQVMTGDEVVITRGGVPVARLVPVHMRGRRVLGIDEGAIELSDDFDAPLPDDVLDAFER
jgi:prevent-host-death family protein